MIDLHFAEPQWVHLLWIVLAFVAILAWLEYRGGDALSRFISGVLQTITVFHSRKSLIRLTGVLSAVRKRF